MKVAAKSNTGSALYTRESVYEDYSSTTVKKTRYPDDNYRKKMSFPYVSVMGYRVFSGKIDDIEFSREKTLINTINAHSYVVAKSDRDFSNALKASDILIADGFPIVMAAKILKDRKINKIAGEDIFFYLLRKLNFSSGKCFFLGSSEETLEKIHNRLKFEYPDIRTEFYSPPYKEKFSGDDNEIMIGKVNEFCPDVLFVGMTAPKQEKWVSDNKSFINTNIICSIGAVFDFYSRNIRRPSRFWVALRLEWFIRLIKEPRRLWKRYLISSPKFLKELLFLKLGITKLDS